MCHGAPNAGWDRCFSCDQTIAQVTRGTELIVPISLTNKQGQFYHVLYHYKGGYALASELLQMGALFARFLFRHRKCVRAKAGRDWDTITIVPSSGSRTGTHPLASVLSLVPSLKKEYRSLLKKGTATIGHNHAEDNGYAVTSNVGGARVLLIDDTFTTGGRVQSAASALQLAGADVVAVVVAARVITPAWNEESKALWDRQRAQTFSFDLCCLDTHS